MSRTPVARNALANLAGRLISAAMAVVLMPALARLLSATDLAVVVLFLSLQALLGILDFGLGPAATRELARLSGRVETGGAMREVLSRLGSITLALAVGIAGVGWWAARSPIEPAFADRAPAMGFAIGASLLGAFFTNALTGLERQVLANAITILAAIVRMGGGLLAVVAAPDPVAGFLAMQALGGLVQAVAAASASWGATRGAGAGRAERPDFRGVARMAGATLFLGVASAVLTQTDRWVVAFRLGSEALGPYGAMVILGTVPQILGSAVFMAVHPRLTALVASEPAEALRFYRAWSERLAPPVVGFGLATVAFAPSAAGLWLGKAPAPELSAALAILAAGSTLSSLTFMPYALQIAHNEVRISAVANGLMTIPAAIAFWLATGWAGLPGAAAVWLGINFTILFGVVPVVHRRLAPELGGRWWRDAIAAPFAAAALASFGARALIGSPGGLAGLAALAGAGVGASFLAWLSTPSGRQLGAARRPRTREETP